MQNHQENQSSGPQYIHNNFASLNIIVPCLGQKNKKFYEDRFTFSDMPGTAGYRG